MEEQDSDLQWSKMIPISKVFNAEWLIGSIGFLILCGAIQRLTGIFSSFFIFLKIVHGNRDSKKHSGKHLADRFIDLWFSTNTHYWKDGGRYGFQYGLNSSMSIFSIDSELERYGLVTLDSDGVYGNCVTPIISLRNRIVLWLSILFLSFISGGGIKYYRDMKIKHR